MGSLQSYILSQKGEDAMKSLGILSIGVLCVILSYAFSYASDLQCVKRQQGKQVKIAWDAVTELENGEDIYSYYPEGYAIGYLLYHSDKKELTERNEEIDSKPDPGPSSETYSTLKFFTKPCQKYFTKPCQKYVGVRAAIYRNKKLESQPVARSAISWSDNPSCTSNKPFVVEIQE
jgi:hypothetical protein